jgi:hypothetical protein
MARIWSIPMTSMRLFHVFFTPTYHWVETQKGTTVVLVKHLRLSGLTNLITSISILSSTILSSILFVNFAK